MANRFWVGGTGTWDNSATTHWSTSSGGSSGASAPGSGDDVILDGSSGGGTVTVNANLTINSLNMDEFTGTLTFATNNNNITLGTFSGTGTATRTLSMGNGTWTVTGSSGAIWNMYDPTNLTVNSNSSQLTFSGGSGEIYLGGKTYNNVTLAATSAATAYLVIADFTCATFTISPPNWVAIWNSATITATTFNISGSAFDTLVLLTGQHNGNVGNLSKSSGTASFAYIVAQEIAVVGGATFNATNSFKGGAVTGFTSFTGPSAGGGGVIGVIGS